MLAAVTGYVVHPTAAMSAADEEEYPMDETRVRQRLNEILAELDRITGKVQEESDEFREEKYYESGRVSQHPAEYGTDVRMMMEQNLLLEDAEQERERVLDALHRLDEGTYGICVDCGRPIDEARLEARPQAERCLADEEKAEQRAAR